LNKNLPVYEEKYYKSFASSINDKASHFVESIVRFLESKLRVIIGECKIEFFLTDNGQIWLIGAE
jgi:hypothetical protein